MRVNIYAEEMTDRVEIVEKEVEGQKFTGVRFYLELPVTTTPASSLHVAQHISGPFMHGPGDDDSAAVTFWGKAKLRVALEKALDMLGAHEYITDGGNKRAFTQAHPAHPSNLVEK